MKQGTNKKANKVNSSRVKQRGLREYIERHNWWTWVGESGSLAWMKPRIIHALAFLTLILSLLMMVVCTTAKADLTVTVTPGYQFSPGENPAVATLNQLGIPVIVITGTLGSNSLSPASISGIALVDTFPDGGVLNLPSGHQTIGWNTANPRQISVNAAGIVDSYSCLVAYDTNALTILMDPRFFAAATNTMGNNGTNKMIFGTGSVYTNEITLLEGSIYDDVIAPGGISSVSITNAGLNANTENTKQIFTNIYTIPGGFWTNTVTNINTVVVGNTNSLGVVAQLASGLILTNVPQISSTNISGTFYYATDSVPTLEFAPTVSFTMPIPGTNSNPGLVTTAVSITNVNPMGVAPGSVYPVLVCTTNISALSSPFIAGEEIPLASMYNESQVSGQPVTNALPYLLTATSSNIVFTTVPDETNSAVWPFGTWTVKNRTSFLSGTYVNVQPTNFVLKFYIRQ